MTTLNIDLDDSTYEELNEIAITQGKNSIELVREVIRHYLEDAQDIQVAAEVLARLEKGESHTISLDELEERLNAVVH